MSYKTMVYKGPNQVLTRKQSFVSLWRIKSSVSRDYGKSPTEYFFGLFVQRIGLRPSKPPMSVRFTHGPPNLALGVATSEDDCDTVTINNFQLAVDLICWRWCLRGKISHQCGSM